MICYYFTVDKYYNEEHGKTTSAKTTKVDQLLLFRDYCLDADRQDGNTLFIGKFNRNPKQPNETIPVVIRRYLTAQVDNEKFDRDLKALRSPTSKHENFIQYFDHTPADIRGFT